MKSTAHQYEPTAVFGLSYCYSIYFLAIIGPAYVCYFCYFHFVVWFKRLILLADEIDLATIKKQTNEQRAQFNIYMSVSVHVFVSMSSFLLSNRTVFHSTDSIESRFALMDDDVMSVAKIKIND